MAWSIEKMHSESEIKKEITRMKAIQKAQLRKIANATGQRPDVILKIASKLDKQLNLLRPRAISNLDARLNTIKPKKEMVIHVRH